MAFQYKSNKSINHILYQLIENQKFAEASDIIEYAIIKIPSEEMKTRNNEIRGFISLVIKFYIMTFDNDKLETFYLTHQESLMKRDILMYTRYFYLNNYEKALEHFIYLISNYYLDSSNLLFLIENNMFKFIEILNGFYIKLKDYENFVSVDNYSILQKYPFDEKIISQIILQINISKKEKLLSFYESVVNIPQTKIIIDAGNILFSFGGNITVAGYNLLIELVEYYMNINIIPIVIIHNRHLKTTFKGSSKSTNIISCINKIKNVCSKFIFETPYNENDDFYIIYLSLLLECKIFSNDNYKDHVFNFRTNETSSDENMAQNYIDDLVVNYSIECGKFIINDFNSMTFSKCIQIIDNDAYIPTIDNTFVQLSLKS